MSNRVLQLFQHDVRHRIFVVFVLGRSIQLVQRSFVFVSIDGRNGASRATGAAELQIDVIPSMSSQIHHRLVVAMANEALVLKRED